MALSDADKTLVEQAKQLVDLRGDGQRHTVAAAARSRDGRTVAALNLYHFSGGPCAELAVLARAVSEGLNDLVRVVAVGDAGRGVLSPCGRCRQVLFDYCPTISVIVEADGQERVVPLAELLPWSRVAASEPG